MRKLICILLLFWAASLCAQTNFYVSPSGSDSNNGTSSGTAWATWAKANTSATLGAGGTIVHFADGTYVGSGVSCGALGTANFCVSHGGTSSQPFIYQCDNGINGNAGHPGSPGHCLLRGSSDSNNAQMLATVTADYVTIRGFDIGGDAGHPATQQQAAIQINTKDGTGNHMELNSNYAHDVATNAPSGNNPDGEGAGCPQQGVFVYNSGNPPASNRNPMGGRFIGNWINNGGKISNTACNQFHGMYIGAGRNIVVQNNIVGNTTGSGIKLYASVCQSVVSHNLVYHTSWWGILVATTSDGNTACSALGGSVGHSTISNNQLINTGFNKNCGAIAEASGSGSNLYTNNEFIGNNTGQNVPVVNCTTTPISAVNTFNSTNGATLGNTFKNYQDSGLGDYSIPSGGFPLGKASTACASGGLTPCVPSTTILGVARQSVSAIGPYDSGSSSAAPPNPPTSPSAVVN